MNPHALSLAPVRPARPGALSIRVASAAIACSLLLAATPASRAANWPNWRGPSFNGASEEKKLPTRWTRTEGVAWTTPMPGPSGATPAIWGDTIFVSSTDDTAKTCLAMAFDRKTGKELWRVKIADGVGKDRMSTYSNPSPVTDGRHVWFFFGTGDLVCLDFKGQEVWKRNIQKDYGAFAFQWTFSTSPVLHDGRLVLQVLQRDTPVDGRGRKDGPNESYIVAMAPETGKELWKVIRPAEARDESLESFATPTPYRHAGRDELLVAGGDCLSGHDPKTGKELWRWGTWNPTRIGHWRLVPSPAAGDGIVLGCGPKDAPIYAVKLGGNGTLPNSQLAWQSFIQAAEDTSKAAPSLDQRDLSSDVPTPLFYEGRFYVLNGRKKVLISIDPKTGKTFWSGSLPGKGIFETSPTAGAGKIYAINHAGEVFVVQAGGSEFKLLHTVAMADPDEKSIRPCVVPSNGQLFIRTAKNLFCVSGQE
jgi:outer membrane protein assembly factor BamB